MNKDTMRTAYEEVGKRLQDPFFEIRYLGKDTIMQRTLPIDKYGLAPDNFLFTDWTQEDDSEPIEYSFQEAEIGKLLIANTYKGICFLGFVNDKKANIKEDFICRFSRNQFIESTSDLQKTAVEYCNGNTTVNIPLHLKGTDFQVGIWKKLVRIPEGWLSTYGSLVPGGKGAQAIGAVVGANPVSYIIPCHRIVKSDGNFHGYHWGSEIKRKLLAYELLACGL